MPETASKPSPYSAEGTATQPFIQISCSAGPDGHDLYALDLTGTVWRFIFTQRFWIRLPNTREEPK